MLEHQVFSKSHAWVNLATTYDLQQFCVSVYILISNVVKPLKMTQETKNQPNDEARMEYLILLEAN